MIAVYIFFYFRQNVFWWTRAHISQPDHMSGVAMGLSCITQAQQMLVLEDVIIKWGTRFFCGIICRNISQYAHIIGVPGLLTVMIEQHIVEVRVNRLRCCVVVDRGLANL